MQLNPLRLALIVLVIFCTQSCKQAGKATKVPPDILTTNADTTISPRTDFFSYCNGKWIKGNPIPASESSWGIGNLITDEIRDRLKRVNEKAANSNAALGSDDQKIGDFYRSAMDSVGLASSGRQIKNQFFSKIDSSHSLDQLLATSAMLTSMDCENLFSFGVGQDDRNSAVMQVDLGQGGLNLPNRDYYFGSDSSTSRIRNQYKIFVAAILGQGGVKGDQKHTAEQVFDFEKSLAKVSRKLEDLRDPYANYHKMTLAAASAIVPALGLGNYLSRLKVDRVDSVIVGQPEFFAGLNKSLKAVPLDVLKSYMKLCFLNHFASAISDSVDKIRFHFYGSVLSGSKVQKLRWKRTLDMEQRAMGMLLGRIYIRDYFSAKAKERYSLMVNRVKAALAARIQNLSWMSTATKTKALEKLSKVAMKVGYPDRWRDYSTLKITRFSLGENLIAAGRFSFDYMISKYHKPVDRTLWGMTPQTYNAYYNPSNNEIVLPAAMLTVPARTDDELDDAIVYGYVAASTIGHEITHGFDDEGRQFDQNGNLRDWWQKSDATAFKSRAQRIIDQFQNFKLGTGQHLNGKASQGENIADLGGILVGLDAFKKTDQYKKGKKISNLTPLQRFFMGYSLGWLEADRPEVLSMQVLTDVHAPARFRVNGPVSNVADFYTAFNVRPGDAMYIEPSKRVEIW